MFWAVFIFAVLIVASDVCLTLRRNRKAIEQMRCERDLNYANRRLPL